MANKKITTIGGGSGQFVLLSSLRDIKKIEITSIVSMADSGGSTGRLRDELGILPPGDILKCLLALSPNREYARKLLQTRFKHNNRLKGHNAGNMLLTFLSQYTGNFPEGVDALGDILGAKGRVLPVTTDKATLVAELSNGERIFGEEAIDVPRGTQREKIVRTYLVPHHASEIKVHPPVISAIKNSDYIIVGPGDIYTSIVPNFLVPEVRDAVSKSRAKIIYIMNIMTKFGESDAFLAMDFIDLINKTMARRVDIVLQNSTVPNKVVLENYKKQKAFFVEPTSLKLLNKTKLLKEDLLDESDKIIRHDKKKLSLALNNILEK